MNDEGRDAQTSRPRQKSQSSHNQGWTLERPNQKAHFHEQVHHQHL